MKIVVIGGSGLIGSKLVTKLRERGHETLAASPASGVNTLTGQGLAAAVEGASVVTDVSNSPSFEDAAVLKFFQTSTRNLLTAESTAGVRHHVALSVVAAERLPDSGYLRAKIAQEKLIEDSPIPYSIVHATQFFEFVGRIADEATSGNTVRLAHVLIQPMAAGDVASALADVTVGPRRPAGPVRPGDLAGPADQYEHGDVPIRDGGGGCLGPGASPADPPRRVARSRRDLPVIDGTLIRLQVDHLPGDRDPKPVWLWRSRPGALDP